MKSRIGLVVIALATATPAFAQSSDQPTTKTAPGISQSALSGARSAVSAGQPSAVSVAQDPAAKAKRRAERDQAEARITAQLNRQQLAKVTSTATATQARIPSTTPQTAAQPSDCPSGQANCLPDARAPQ